MRRQGICILAVILLIVLFQSAVFAQTPQITIGLNYLLSTQSPDGSWGNKTSGAEILPSTIATIETLKALNQTNTPTYVNALVWLQPQGLQTTDYLAGRIQALSVAGTDADLLISYLDEIYTGAWGGDDSPDVDNLDTLLALQALKRINYPDQDLISTALFYLIGNQNADGGWGFRQGEDSEVYYTALVLQTLSQFKGTYDLNASIASAVAYILTKQNIDGGFGSGVVNLAPTTSTIFETALAVMALIESGQQSALSVQHGLDYLSATQLPNGSWDDDPYSTALALRALASVKANLTVSPGDIVFSNPTPKKGDSITITANIKNTGPTQTPSTGSGQNGVSVQFYDGNPASGGNLIGETTIASIPAYGIATASITWTIPSAAGRSIFVSVDPLNNIDELNETDNIASKNLTSATLPDLSITSADIDIFPPAPDPYIMTGIYGKLRNLGESDASNVVVDFYLEASGQSPILLAGSGGIYTVPAGGVVDISAAIAAEQASSGQKTIRVIVDPLNSLAEPSKTNNQAAKSFIIGASVDLTVSSSEISFSPANPKDGDIITITSSIRNADRGTVKNVAVRHYLGDPADGGTRIGSELIIPTITGYGSETITMQWNTTGVATLLTGHVKTS